MRTFVTIAVASAYRSQHFARHCCSLLLRLLLGFVTHALKHLSRTVCKVSEIGIVHETATSCTFGKKDNCVVFFPIDGKLCRNDVPAG
jgi:hypothetical protein